MALQSYEIATVYRVLGYPLSSSCPFYKLEGAIAVLDDAGCEQVMRVLGLIESAEQALECKALGKGSGVKKVGDIEWFEGRGVCQVKALYNKYVQQLASMLGVQPRVMSGAGHIPMG